MNVNIREDNLRWAWDAILMLEKYQKLEPIKKSAETEEWASERIKDIKIGIRKFYKKQEELPEVHYFDGEEAGYYRVVSETNYKSVEEAEENHVPLTCYPDQLGRWFEISHKFFRKSNGKVYGYAWMALNW